MVSPRSWIDRLRPASEVVVLAMACLSPWAIGAVDAWAQLILDVGLVVLAVLALFTGGRSDWPRRMFCLPSLALAGLALLALAQAVPLPLALERTIAPATHAWRLSLAPDQPQGVQADAQPRVAPPAATLSHDPDASLRTAAQLAAAWLLFQVVLDTGTGVPSLRRFGFVTVANASLLTVFSVAQALSWSGKIYGIRPTPGGAWFTGGPFVSHNHLAAYLNLAFGLALGFLLVAIQQTARGRDERTARSLQQSARLWAGSAAGLVFAGILASHSRGGFLAAVISAAVTLIVLRPRSVRLGATLGVLVVVSALFLIVMGRTSPFERLATIKDPSEESIQGRFQVWGVALRTWASYPVWGTGLGSFPAATAAHYRKQFGAVYFSHAESEYMHMLTEGGVVGLALALVAVVTIARLGRRALHAAADPQQRALVLGALAGGLALLIQCLTDFPLHIPGVAITAVILAAQLCRLGLEASEREPVAKPRGARPGALAARLAMVGLSVALVVPGFRLARAEALVRSVGLPFPGTLMPTVEATQGSQAEMNRTRIALEAALRSRPNWAEGHLRLGTVMLGLYSALAKEWVGQFQQEKDPEVLAILADPLWLHRVVHSASAADLAEVGGVVTQQPVRDYLVPAARCFLEARRCSPDLALAHARLSELDYLIEPRETTAVHAERALRLAGYDQRVLLLAGQAAVQADDIDLAARCWRKAIAVHKDNQIEVVVAAATLMTPDQILEKVLPPGARLPLLLADRLYSGPESNAAREKFLRASIERLAGDTELSPAERLWVEGQARARLGEPEQARKVMTEALAAEPIHADWREEFIGLLIAWGDIDEAARQARIGSTLHPDHPGIQRALRSALDAFAQGNAKTGSAH
jgi:O-antigen ligase/tetratricopeptide (TPR) repeat protein